MDASTQYAIESQATAAGIDPAIALAVATVESGGNQGAISSAGAIGIFQLLASTAAGLNVDPSDATQNIQGGIAYLAQLYAEFGDWPDSLAAYNWGPGNVAKAGPGNYPAQVQAYVNQVLSLASQYGSLTATADEAITDVGLESLIPSSTLGYALWGVAGVALLALVFD